MSAHKGVDVFYKDMNHFACLASDSDSSDEEVAPSSASSASSAPSSSASSASSAPASSSKNVAPSVPTEQYRVWLQDDTPGNRFTVQPTTFSSPFTKAKRWTRARFQEDSDGWTSISWSQPQFVEDSVAEPALDAKSVGSTPSDEDIPPVQTSSTHEFPSLLLRSTVDESPSQQQQQTSSTAAMWAERVKKQLDKAEAVREEKGRLKAEAVREGAKLDDRLSFFRRARVVEE